MTHYIAAPAVWVFALPMSWEEIGKHGAAYVHCVGPLVDDDTISRQLVLHLQIQCEK